jgi:predicted phosphodiesterase
MNPKETTSREVRRLVVVSDTHGFHDRIALPDGDVLVHCGDFCSHGLEEEARAFADFFRAQRHPHKVVIAGNHDRCLERAPALAAELFAGASYLFDSGATVAGLRFWGAPWQPWFLDWAFNLPRGEPLREKWQLIDERTDVLVTHGPPQHVLDRTFSDDHAGCEELRAAVERLSPRLHLFGHIHEGYGSERQGGTLFINAASCTLAYRPDNPAVVVDVPLDRNAPAMVVSASGALG